MFNVESQKLSRKRGSDEQKLGTTSVQMGLLNSVEQTLVSVEHFKEDTWLAAET